MVGLPSAGSHTQPAMHAVTQDDVLSASSVLAMLSFFAVDSPGAASDSTPAEQPVAVIVARAANQHPQTERNTALIVIPPTPNLGARSLRNKPAGPSHLAHRDHLGSTRRAALLQEFCQRVS